MTGICRLSIAKTGGLENMACNNNRDQKMGKGVRFERIRRITGYLVGNMDKWNNAKKAEEKDRVKHGVGKK
jgi:ribonucleoside-triphosphate reductase